MTTTTAFDVAAQIMDKAARLGERFELDEIGAEHSTAAHVYIASYRGDFGFLLSLQRQYASGRLLTYAQIKGVLNCLVADARKQLKPPASQPLGADLSPIFTLFQAAQASRIKWPKVRLQTADGTTIVLKRCGAASAHAGAINVVSAEKVWNAYLQQDSAQWFGRINADGTLVSGKAMTQSILTALTALAADPAGVAAAYGKQTGNCCFCSTPIETKESMAVGYGPICAEHYGLPWGVAA